MAHEVLCAAWSGEEMGVIGSADFADNVPKSTDFPKPPAVEASAEAPTVVPDTLYPSIIACLNLDMIGRLRDKLVLQGVGSSTVWPSEIERRNAVVGLDVTMQNDSYLPTDASTFFLKGVPILSAFTG
ncbi:MAG: M28 family peptidase, partial [Pirellulaceae bacterium]